MQKQSIWQCVMDGKTIECLLQNIKQGGQYKTFERLLYFISDKNVPQYQTIEIILQMLHQYFGIINPLILINTPKWSKQKTLRFNFQPQIVHIVQQQLFQEGIKQKLYLVNYFKLLTDIIRILRSVQCIQNLQQCKSEQYKKQLINKQEFQAYIEQYLNMNKPILDKYTYLDINLFKILTSLNQNLFKLSLSQAQIKCKLGQYLQQLLQGIDKQNKQNQLSHQYLTKTYESLAHLLKIYFQKKYPLADYYWKINKNSLYITSILNTPIIHLHIIKFIKITSFSIVLESYIADQKLKPIVVHDIYLRNMLVKMFLEIEINLGSWIINPAGNIYFKSSLLYVGKKLNVQDVKEAILQLLKIDYLALRDNYIPLCLKSALIPIQHFNNLLQHKSQRCIYNLKSKHNLIGIIDSLIQLKQNLYYSKQQNIIELPQMEYQSNSMLIQKFQRFQIQNQEMVAQGGFSQILKAKGYFTDDKIGRIVVIKRCKNTAQNLFQLRLQNELHILSSLKYQSSWLCNYFITIQQPQFLFIQYYQTNLKTFILNNKSKVNLCIKINIAAQIILGVKYLHTNQILHLDLKPQNILLTDSLKIKIIDFGQSISSCKDNMQTRPGISYSYSAFELVDQQGEISQSCDIFSIGCIIYFIIFQGKQL